MSVKKYPTSLFELCIDQVAESLLQQWRNTYYSNFTGYSEELKSTIGTIIPFTIYDQVFHLMIENHARSIQNGKIVYPPSVPALIDSVIVPHLRKLNLNGLRHMGIVADEQIRYLEGILTKEIPSLTNLVEISLQTSGTDSTLPICTDEILEKIGLSCSKLKSLDISYNYTVTDHGLEKLVPSEVQNGCPQLVKISLFECSVTDQGIASLLDGLPLLKFLGYRETGLALMYLNKQKSNTAIKKLELVHINNLGTINRTCKDLFKLKCNNEMINVLSNMCPKLNGLKVRVDDPEVKFLKQITSCSILELVYNTGVASSPGNSTVQYLQLCGAQFISLSFCCDTFSTQMLSVVCEQCVNLKRLWIRCNQFSCDKDITNSDKKKCVLTNLKVFFFRVGYLGLDHCRIPHSVFNYVLHKTSDLKELVLAMKNVLVSDSYIQELFSSIQTLKLKRVMILVPYKNMTVSSVNLSMATVETLMAMCPKLENLGNLLVWDISLEEIQELRRQLKISNSALILTYKMVFS